MFLPGTKFLNFGEFFLISYGLLIFFTAAFYFFLEIVNIKTTLFFILPFHIISFIAAEIIIITFFKGIIVFNNIIKSRFPNIKLISTPIKSSFDIFSDKNFLQVSNIISYFFSMIIVLFIIPLLILEPLNNNVAVELAKSEINLYQQFFVFASIPILSSMLKK